MEGLGRRCLPAWFFSSSLHVCEKKCELRRKRWRGGINTHGKKSPLRRKEEVVLKLTIAQSQPPWGTKSTFFLWSVQIWNEKSSASISGEVFGKQCLLPWKVATLWGEMRGLGTAQEVSSARSSGKPLKGCWGPPSWKTECQQAAGSFSRNADTAIQRQRACSAGFHWTCCSNARCH